MFRFLDAYIFAHSIFSYFDIAKRIVKHSSLIFFVSTCVTPSYPDSKMDSTKSGLIHENMLVQNTFGGCGRQDTGSYISISLLSIV